MSDTIPPLISSSPPPMPDFDEEDEDDDVEFGMGSGIGDLTLDFSDMVAESKDKILDIEHRQLKIGVRNEGWKCEEQDSTSQDSGLCMASQSSEGMSPLPQSDDEDRVHQDHDADSIAMKHSSTVMFNSDVSSSTVLAFNESIEEIEHIECKVVPVDTGQTCFDKESVEFSLDSKTKDHNQEEEKCESDDEFGNWNCANQNSLQDEKIVVNDISNVNLDLEISSHNSVISEENSCLGENVFNPLETSFEVDSKDSTKNDKVNSIPVRVNNDFVESPSEEDNNNCICDQDNSIQNDEKSVTEPIDYFKDDDHQLNREDNDEFDDDFGNFESVTTTPFTTSNDLSTEPASSLDNSIFNKEVVLSEEESYGEFTFKEYGESDYVNTESKSDLDLSTDSFKSYVHHSSKTENEIDETTILKPSDIMLEVLEDSEVVKTYSNDAIDGDDDFDEFSDFTQSSQIDPCNQVYEDTSNTESLQKNSSAQEGLERLFPKPDLEVDDAQTEVLEKGIIWHHLCPLENSPALTFQWSNSKSHNKLLSALSIDSRNILFGPRWNSNIPRFAANLGTNPLQPVKAADVPITYCSAAPNSSSSINASSITPQNEETVPDAHFDWVGSGLTNPLDCTEKSSSNTRDVEENIKRPRNIDNLKVLSSEAEKIISLLPDLSFMKKTYIEVLISKV